MNDRVKAATGHAVALDGVSKVYGKGRRAVAALRDVTVDLPRGRFTAVMGPSGSGKSTFLHCAAGLDRVCSGTVRLGETDLTRMDEKRLTILRRERIGFVFQAFNLVPSLTVRDNVALPLRLAGARVDHARVREILTRVGLQGREGHRPAELSGGQQQRVAIARALVADPEVVFGDEPTGALDTMTAREVLTLLRETVDELAQTVVMVTHDPVAASYADAVLFLADGRIVDTLAAPTAGQVADRMTKLGAWA
ncbi:ABC transporter ATP-binding protein [Actinocorallia sp. A-T 12471]|uniref:ABC transporter ATP-binding protein n=1 Tax=Actinocorallia sp. A-T 12471 TaxID=3089813 RepID=UPI0029CF8474|nr:ABC transporter ATP-binding protein [Actinocorallia sp. A-T 12471]MDX6742572.1 ABC transporter ATP-binding protein [Actinocorallia sp. A-T 12471]